MKLLEHRQVPTLYRVHESLTRSASPASSSSSTRSSPDPAAAGPARPERGGRAGRRRQPPRRRGASGAATDARRTRRSRCGTPAGLLQRAQSRPRGARPSPAYALHLPDPPVSGPRRPPRPAVGDRRGRGRARSVASTRGRVAMLGARARGRTDRARRGRGVRVVLLERELFEAGGSASSRRSRGSSARAPSCASAASWPTCTRASSRRACSATSFELNETETALVGRRSGRALRLGDPVEVRVDSIEAPRGRVDLAPVAEVEEAPQRERREAAR